MSVVDTIVVCGLVPLPSRPGAGGTLVFRLRGLALRGRAWGARVIAVSHRGVVLGFAPNVHAVVPRFVMEATAAEQGQTPWAFGAAAGELEEVLENDERFLHGMPLVLAQVLAEAAAPGELWVTDSFMESTAVAPRVSSERSAEVPGGMHVKAYVLRAVSDIELDRAQVNADALDLAAGPPTPGSVPVASAVPADRPSRSQNISAPAGSMSERMLSALYRGHEGELDEMFGGLDLEGKDPSLLRMGAVTRLRRGDVRTALSVLQRARVVGDDKAPDTRSRTSLALAIALMWAGRHQDALLEIMNALARARESRHVQGEEACVRVLRLLCERAERANASSLLAAAVER